MLSESCGTNLRCNPGGNPEAPSSERRVEVDHRETRRELRVGGIRAELGGEFSASRRWRRPENLPARGTGGRRKGFRREIVDEVEVEPGPELEDCLWTSGRHRLENLERWTWTGLLGMHLDGEKERDEL